jgi:hypothetical protein
MYVKNLTNSAYQVDLRTGGFTVVPAFEEVLCEPTEEFLNALNPEFWAIRPFTKAEETVQTKPSKK